jgi:hypothetical protein
LCAASNARERGDVVSTSKEYIVRVHLQLEAGSPEDARQKVLNVLEAYTEVLDEIPGLVSSCLDNTEEIQEA